jgi:hypothetical protein
MPKTSTSRSRLCRTRNPVRYAYQTLKDNAKRRGKVFAITFEAFEAFCRKHEYVERKGIAPDSLTIDRIDFTLGYTPDNMTVLTLRDNSAKGGQEGFGTWKPLDIEDF